MNKEKQIKVSEEIFVNISKLLYLIDKYNFDDENITKLINDLKGQINAKFEALEKRKIFTEYKTSKPTTKEREEKRQKYLNKTNISKNWKSEKETPY